MSTEQHVQAFLDLAKADSLISSMLHDGVVLPDAEGHRPERYVSFFDASPSRSVTRYTGEADRESYTFVTHAVGETRAQARALSDRLTDALLGRRLAVAGRSCSRIEHPLGLPIEEDRDTTPLLFYAVDEWTFWSDPA